MDSRKKVSLQTVKSFVINWNNRFPIDLWWRKKYNVAFNSEQHRKLNLIDALIEYQEEIIFKDFIKKIEEEKKNIEEFNLTGNYLKETEMTQEQIDKVFENLDLDSFNNNNKKE